MNRLPIIVFFVFFGFIVFIVVLALADLADENARLRRTADACRALGALALQVRASDGDRLTICLRNDGTIFVAPHRETAR